MNALDPTAPALGPSRRRIDGDARRGAGEAVRSERVQLILGVVAAIAALVLVTLGALNRSLQADVAAGQQRIAGAQAAANVNNTLIRLLAKAAAEKNDDRIRALLSQNGISFREAPAAGGPASAADAVAPLPPK